MAAAFSSSQKSYDAFLNFRGDTRNNFTAHLYQELRTKGINTFFDEDKLERGRFISPALVTAIENSMFFTIVLSENYASSRWCLEELVKILECNKSNEERILPVFYNVDPSDVRNHRGNFGEALAKHEENLEENGERVKIWRKALTQVANLSGWDSRNNDLRYLHLHGYSLKSLPNDFNQKNLVELSMPYSHIKLLWKGIKVLEKLKFMDLSHSKYLKQTPDFSRITNLERLVLEGCINLHKVHPSLGDLNKLNFLSLKNCKMLRNLPTSTCNLKSLEIFILSGCSKFEEFPENFGNLEMLKELQADGIVARVLPSSLFSMRNLQMLSFSASKGPPSASWLWRKRSSNSISFMVPSSSNICSLMVLDLSHCNISDGAHLSSLGFLSSLERLNLSGNNFATLPSISQLSHLRWLLLEDCKRLQAVSELPSSIVSLNARNCTSLETRELLNSLLITVKSKEDPPLEYNGSRLGYNGQAATYSVVIPGTRIPDWIRYQSRGNVIEVDLPPNWFTNVLGFAFALVTTRNDLFCPYILLFLSSSNYGSSYPVVVDLNSVVGYQEMDSNHVFLTYVPIHPSVNWHQVTHIAASFLSASYGNNHVIRRCGLSLMYVNEEVNCDKLPIIQFNSLFSTPPDKSTLVLKEIYAWKHIERDSEGQRGGSLDYYSSLDIMRESASDCIIWGDLDEGEPSGSRYSDYSDSHSCHGSESEEHEN